jgi:hypothetical protein
MSNSGAKRLIWPFHKIFSVIKNVTIERSGEYGRCSGVGIYFASKIAFPLNLNLKARNRGEQLTCGSMATALYDSQFLLPASWYLCQGVVLTDYAVGKFRGASLVWYSKTNSTVSSLWYVSTLPSTGGSFLYFRDRTETPETSFK